MGTLLCPVMVGRSAEWEMLSAALDAGARGAGSSILLTGEAGVGKSRMVRELRKRCVDRGGVALLGRAVDTATPMPFRPLAEVFMAAQRSNAVGDDPDIAPFQAALASLLPGGRGDAPATSVVQVAEGLLRVARAIGQQHDRGAVVVLEDLQWADAETMAVLEYLADNVGDEPVMVVATARLDLERAAVRSLMAAVDRRSVIQVHLGRLNTAQTVEMARRCIGQAPAEVLQWVTERAEGLPFFVEELLAGLQNDGLLVREGGDWVARRPHGAVVPVTFAQSVRRRFGSLPAQHRSLLLDAALLGRQIDPDLLSGIGGRDDLTVQEMVSGAIDVGLLIDDEWGIRFRHALTRDVVLTELRPSERSARAQHVLAVLKGFDPVLRDAHVDGAADLAEWAGDRDFAGELLLRVARSALRQGALTTAESALRRAHRIVVGAPQDLLVGELLVEVLALAGRVEEVFLLGADVLGRLDGAAAQDSGGRRRAAVHLALARCAVAATDWPLATGQLAQARACADRAAPGLVARVTALQAVVALGEYRHAESVALASAAVEAAESSADPDLLCEALLVLGRSTRVADLAGAEAAFDRSRVVARAAGLAHLQARALAELGTIDFYRGGGPERLVVARALARACGALETEAVAEQHLAIAAWNRDDADAMRHHAEAAIAMARRYRLGMLLPSALILLACAHAVRGDTAAMEAALVEAAPMIEDDPTQRVGMHAQARATCALARDDLATAGRELATATAIVRSSRPAALPMMGMAAVLTAVDGTDPTAAITELRAMGYHQMRPLGALLLVADAVARGRGGAPEVASALMAEAMSALETQPFMRAICWRLVAACAATDGWGEPADWLRAAQPIFEERGLTEPARAVLMVQRRLLGRHTATPGPDDARTTGEITVREREVLALVAEGLPNRSIATRMFVSPRTVEKHVERLLAKTGSANRAQLATYAVRNPQRS